MVTFVLRNSVTALFLTAVTTYVGKVTFTFAILLIFTHVGVGGGGVSGLGEISSSGATSGLSANILSKSICLEKNKCSPNQYLFCGSRNRVQFIKILPNTWKSFDLSLRQAYRPGFTWLFWNYTHNYENRHLKFDFLMQNYKLYKQYQYRNNVRECKPIKK